MLCRLPPGRVWAYRPVEAGAPMSGSRACQNTVDVSLIGCLWRHHRCVRWDGTGPAHKCRYYKDKHMNCHTYDEYNLWHCQMSLDKARLRVQYGGRLITVFWKLMLRVLLGAWILVIKL